MYQEGKESANSYHVFRIHDFAEMSEERMRKALYPREPQGNYFIFRFDEEVSFDKLNLTKILEEFKTEEYGKPIIRTGGDLIRFRI